MTRPLLLAGALLAFAGDLRAPKDSDEDSLEKVQKEFERAMSRAGKNAPDPATIEDLVERAIGFGIDQESVPAGFEAWYFVLELLPYVPAQRQSPLFVETMDALIEHYLDDDRMAFFLMGSSWYTPEPLKAKAKEYADWIERDSKSRGVKFAKGWRRCSEEIVAALDEATAARLIAQLEDLKKQCESIPDLGRKWSSMVDESLDQLRVIGAPAREIAARDLDGVEFKLSDYRGKVVLLDFWGYW